MGCRRYEKRSSAGLFAVTDGLVGGLGEAKAVHDVGLALIIHGGGRLPLRADFGDLRLRF